MTDLSLLHLEIHEGSVWALLRRTVSRRVPASDVDDVVQATLCDALDAGRIPERRDDLRRWLVGIARNKATDHFRRRCREIALDTDALAVPSHAPSADSMVLLKNAIADANRLPMTRGAMDLALREADGESYAELARGGASSEVALRQRVSRFRRTMAARWLTAAALGILLVGGLAAHVLGTYRLTPRAILPDVDPQTRIALRPMEGLWTVVAWTGSEPLARSIHVDVRSGSVRVVLPGNELLFAASEIERRPDGAETWRLTSPSHGRVEIFVERSGPRATVTLRDGRWAGTATLMRRSTRDDAVDP
ncbi:RNA polymerase sigma factor [Pendulispora albinea]|uniref:RNA polymerase sigma-70 region 2 domain-containing protein n=1 Tax=Pendulispora albinea TaxID=2741071 RepID=A0ABZ2M6X2_9BACT